MKKIVPAYCLVVIMMLGCKTPSKSSSTTAGLPSAPDAITLTVVSFNSICCGVRSDEFLKTYYQAFQKEHKVNVAAKKYTGCGKEGEYKIVFYSGNLSAVLQEKFSAGLESLIANELKTNTGNDKGSVNAEVVKSVDTSFCRGGATSF